MRAFIALVAGLFVVLPVEAGFQPGSQEVARTARGNFFCVTGAWGAWAEGGRSRAVVMNAADGTNEMIFQQGPRDLVPLTRYVREGGPVSYGVVEEAYHASSYTVQGNSSQFDAPPTKFYSNLTRFSDVIEAHRLGWGSKAKDVFTQMDEFRVQHAALCTPIVSFVRSGGTEVWSDWNIFYDVIYTSYEDVTAVAVRDGQMHIWNLNETGNAQAEWAAQEPFMTAIDGPFRLLRAGEDLANMYFIDEEGAIYTGFGADHKRIGTVQNYHAGDPDTLTLVFEDQMTQKIGILHAAADDTITVLPIEWSDASHASDFMTSIDAPELRENLDRMADVLREDRPE